MWTRILFHEAHIAAASGWLSAGLADTPVCLKNAEDKIYLLLCICKHLPKQLVRDLQDWKIWKQPKTFLKTVM